jgi:hypothetical protein
MNGPDANRSADRSRNNLCDRDRKRLVGEYVKIMTGETWETAR